MLRLALVAVLAAAPLCAQAVCPTVNPPIVTQGVATSITIKVDDATGAGFQHPTNCLTTTIHQGLPGGTAVPLPINICGATWVTVPPYGSATKIMGLPATLAAGQYFVKIRYRLMGTTTALDEWVSFEVQAPGAPTLTAISTARVGQTLSLSINAPSYPGETYLAAASLTTRTGIPAGPGLNIALDPDPVFQLSFPSPLGGLFDNFQGSLDGSGQSLAPSVNLPNVPTLAYLPLHIQVAIVPVAGGPVLTNCLNLCIAP